jgi:hypothetical protein
LQIIQAVPKILREYEKTRYKNGLNDHPLHVRFDEDIIRMDDFLTPNLTTT